MRVMTVISGTRLAAIIAALLLALGFDPAAAAGPVTYSIDFQALAPYAGQTISTAIQEGPWYVVLNDVTVIGPGDPGYAGSIGITIPIARYDVAILDGTGPEARTPFAWSSIAGTFAATPDGDVISWYGATQPAAQGGPFFQFIGTAPDTLTQAPNPSPFAIPLFLLDVSNQNAAQLLGLTIVADLAPTGTTPEPSGLAMGALAIALLTTGRRLSRTRCRGRASR